MALLTRAISACDVPGVGPDASGICGTADLEADLSSLDLRAAAFFPADFACLPAAFAVAADEPLPPCVVLAAAYWQTASRLAQASTATSADRCRRVNFADPQSPADYCAPQRGNHAPPLDSAYATHDLGGKAMPRWQFMAANRWHGRDLRPRVLVNRTFAV